MQKYTVLVTGGNGFIGRNLVAELSNDPNLVVISVDISHSDAYAHNNVTYLKCDLTSQNEVANLPQANFIFHLAAINGTQRFYTEPWFVFYNSLITTINLIDRFKDSNVLDRFVYTSSSEVYADRFSGQEEGLLTKEDVAVGFSNVLNPRWSYGGAKLAGEIALNSAAVQYGLRFSILRYHNVYGPNMGLNHVIPDFVERGRRGIYQLFGGKNVRSFIHIKDAVAATILAGFSEKSRGKIIHIGNEDPVTMIELANIIMSSSGWIGKIEINDAPDGSTNYRCPGTDFLRNKLGFKAEYDLKAGIDHYLANDIGGK
jgi:UDP-glucose 4-epimerase